MFIEKKEKNDEKKKMNGERQSVNFYTILKVNWFN